jgi:DNA-binding NtrC family response regulator
MSKNNAFTVFIVDDDSKFTTMCQHYMDKNSVYNLDIHTFTTGEDCLAHLNLNPDVVVLDYYFDAVDEGAKNGLEVLAEIKRRNPATGVVMISAQDNMDTALETVRKGATDYVIKSDTAIMFTQLTTDKILKEKASAIALRSYKRGMRVLFIVMLLFILGLAGFLLAVTVFGFNLK